MIVQGHKPLCIQRLDNSKAVVNVNFVNFVPIAQLYLNLIGIICHELILYEGLGLAMHGQI